MPLRQLMNHLLGAVSMIPMMEPQGHKVELPKPRVVSRTCGKRKTPYRRYIKYDKVGPFVRVTGWRRVPREDGSNDYWGNQFAAVREKVTHHYFLHATKGWRRRSYVPAGIQVA